MSIFAVIILWSFISKHNRFFMISFLFVWRKKHFGWVLLKELILEIFDFLGRFLFHFGYEKFLCLKTRTFFILFLRLSSKKIVLVKTKCFCTFGLLKTSSCHLFSSNKQHISVRIELFGEIFEEENLRWRTRVLIFLNFSNFKFNWNLQNLNF